MANYSKNQHLNTDKGDASEVILMGELLIRGYSVSVPFGHNNKYDLVVEGRSGKLYRVQVKYKGVFRSKNTVQITDARKYVGLVDVMAVLIVDTWYFFDEKFIKNCSNKLHLNINVRREHVGRRENFDIFV
jgi:hypothetical protein